MFQLKKQWVAVLALITGVASGVLALLTWIGVIEGLWPGVLALLAFLGTNALYKRASP